MFFTHGKVASALRTRGGQPVRQVSPAVMSTVTCTDPAPGVTFFGSLAGSSFLQPADVARITTTDATAVADRNARIGLLLRSVLVVFGLRLAFERFRRLL